MKCLLFLLLVSTVLRAQDAADSLCMFIESQRIAYKVPGLAIGVLKGDSILLQRGFGTLSTLDNTPVTTETVFPILSCTKAFTAAAIAMLVDEGKIKWSDKVIMHLPDFKLSNAEVTKRLTIADLLSHRSGLRSFEGDLLWYKTNYSADEVVRRIRFSPIENKFRSEYGYQNVMYLVAGQILEKVTGKSWNEFIAERIFAPLNMSHSYTSFEGIPRSKFPYPHLSDKPVEPIEMDNIAPAGAINSTIPDMLAWCKLWLNEGRAGIKQIIALQSIKEMVTPKIYLDKKKEEGYGLGWQISGSTISHGGGMPGYKSLVTIDLDNEFAIVVLTNRITYLNEELAGIVIDYLDGESLDWMNLGKQLITRGVRFSWEEHSYTPVPHSLPQTRISEYLGRYEDKQYGEIKIHTESDTAKIQLIPTANRINGYLKHVGKDTFSVTFNDAFFSSGKVIFSRNPENKISSFHFDIPPGEFIFNNLLFRKKE